MTKKKLSLVLLVGMSALIHQSMHAGASAPNLSAARPYFYIAGGIGCLLAAPFIYDVLYYKVASQSRINSDARALLSRVRSRYPQIEQIARADNQNNLHSLVSRFFSQRHRYDGISRRWGLRAPEYDAHRYFNWRTEPFLHQLDKFGSAVNDPRLARELHSIHTALQIINNRVSALGS